MKTNLLFTFFAKMIICLSVFFLNSCKKELPQDGPVINRDELQQTRAAVSKWLDNQKTTANSHKMIVLENVKENLAFEELRIEKLNDSENLIIVPIQKGFKSEVNKGKNPINNLLLIENSAGKIRKGNIVEFIPKSNPGLTSLPPNTFHKYYNEGGIDIDGRLAFLNLNDKLLYQMDYADGKLASYGEKQQGRKDHDNPGMEPVESTQGTYTDWYLVTTYYYTDGSTEIVTEYLYTTYFDDNYFETIFYELQYGDGLLTGGTDEETMLPVQKMWNVETDIHNFGWLLISTEEIKGTKKATLPAGGYFTNIKHLNENLLIWKPADGYGWQKSGVTVAFSGSTAQSIVSGVVTTTNQNILASVIPPTTQTYTFSDVYP